MAIDFLTKASFGHYGSTYLGSEATLDLTGSSASRYIIAILIVTDDSAIATLESLNGEVGMLSTLTAENDLDGTDGIGAGENGGDLSSSVTFKSGTVLYGKWDKIITHTTSGMIVYFAPTLHS